MCSNDTESATIWSLVTFISSITWLSCRGLTASQEKLGFILKPIRSNITGQQRKVREFWKLQDLFIAFIDLKAALDMVDHHIGTSSNTMEGHPKLLPCCINCTTTQRAVIVWTGRTQCGSLTIISWRCLTDLTLSFFFGLSLQKTMILLNLWKLKLVCSLLYKLVDFSCCHRYATEELVKERTRSWDRAQEWTLRRQIARNDLGPAGVFIS